MPSADAPQWPHLAVTGAAAEQLSRIDVLAHRKEVSFRRPSLPALAGRSARKLLDIWSLGRLRQIG
ncbi:MAG TPA: hypothetical protein VNU19_16775 [Candidatus Acidoferrum sp.]|jgi:hypothetical protein|nr:hypothetical protein [Candidatus Acidoferrum sp.]